MNTRDLRAMEACIPKASCAYNGRDQSEHIVLANLGCKCNHMQCVRRPN